MEQQPQEQAQSEQKKRKLPLKAIMVMMAVLLVEGAMISAAFLMAGKPPDVQADQGKSNSAMEQGEKLVETLVIDEKFQNSKRGITYIYDTEIYIQVRQKHVAAVKQYLKDKKQTISQGISTIFRAADPVQLEEPKLATIRQQIKIVLDEHLRLDEGKSVVEQVLIPKCLKYPSD